MGVTIPDLRWEIKDIQAIGDQVIVRGEATARPQASSGCPSPLARASNDGA